MIRWPDGLERLPPADRFGLETLVDLSGVVPVSTAVTGDIVRLHLSDEGEAIDLARPMPEVISASPDDGRVSVPLQLVRLVAEIGGVVAEQRSTARDSHGRVPSSENELVKRGVEREPVLSEWGALLRDSVIRAAGARPVRLLAPWPEGRTWAAALTHDLDVVDWWPLFTGLRLAELTQKGELRQIAKTLGAAAGALAGSPVNAGIARLLDDEAEQGIRSTWFVLSGRPTLRTLAAGDLTYDVKGRRARSILEEVAGAGHEIGLHGSFATMADTSAMRAERERLASLIPRSVEGVRQHYLRMRPGPTQRVMRSADFTYDATYGFPDRNGFRLGAADVLPGWDAGEGRESGLAEVPLTWMDRALSKYRGIEDPEQWIEDALTLADKARAVGGLWVGLWHPNMIDALGYPGAATAYVRLLRGLMASRPYVAPLGEIVAWRTARRSVRVQGIDVGGTVAAFTDRPTSAPLELRDASGQAVERVRPM